MLEIVYGETQKQQIAAQLRDVLRGMQLNGTFYIGYPVIASADEKIMIDAMLVTQEHGLIAFLFRDTAPQTNDADGWAAMKDAQDRIYYALDANLSRHEALRAGRKLAVEIEPIILFPVAPGLPDLVQSRFAGLDNVADVVADCHSLNADYLRPLQSALQRVTTIKPQKKREKVTKASSRGGILKEIEKGVANLDQWQKKAAIETPEGPQRIRGLAGSGKTVVLALKAAYLHAQHPDWNIAVTFQTRSLYQQIQDLIRRFSFEALNDEPNWERLRVMHAWGGRYQDGVYTEIADHLGATPRDFLYGKTQYGMNAAFQGVCAELLSVTNVAPAEPLYDAVLIDEAQDLPPEFFQLIYRFTAAPKRIVWAYDELQTLSESIMPATDDLFGHDPAGRPLVTLNNTEGQPRQDVILPICYRNTPWSLTLAHALGFGIYRKPKLVQHFDDPVLWSEIGYQVVNGSLDLGHEVTIERAPTTYPDYFKRLLNPADAVVCQAFDNAIEQAEWIARSIEDNLGQDELEADDILIILPIALTAKNDAGNLVAALARRNIAAHLAGVTTSRDEMFVKGSIAIANIFRSKGNEAPMVYVANAQACYSGYELIKLRNILFTAITRCRAWVRICGWGKDIAPLMDEINAVRDNQYRLSFRIPSSDELKELRRIHRDRTAGEKAELKKFEKQLRSDLERVVSGEIPMEALAPEVRDLLEQLKARSGDDE